MRSDDVFFGYDVARALTRQACALLAAPLFAATAMRAVKKRFAGGAAAKSGRKRQRSASTPPQPDPAQAAIAIAMPDLGDEVFDAHQYVYLVTVSRVLPGTVATGSLRDEQTLSRNALANSVRDSLDNLNALPQMGGRPRTQTEKSRGVKMVERHQIQLQFKSSGDSVCYLCR